MVSPNLLPSAAHSHCDEHQKVWLNAAEQWHFITHSDARQSAPLTKHYKWYQRLDEWWRPFIPLTTYDERFLHRKASLLFQFVLAKRLSFYLGSLSPNEIGKLSTFVMREKRDASSSSSYRPKFNLKTSLTDSSTEQGIPRKESYFSRSFQGTNSSHRL